MIWTIYQLVHQSRLAGIGKVAITSVQECEDTINSISFLLQNIKEEHKKLNISDNSIDKPMEQLSRIVSEMQIKNEELKNFIKPNEVKEELYTTFCKMNDIAEQQEITKKINQYIFNFFFSLIMIWNIPIR